MIDLLANITLVRLSDILHLLLGVPGRGRRYRFSLVPCSREPQT